MAYVTGSAADMAAVKTALVNACTSNGWTSQTDAGGETVLSKSGIYIRVVSTTDGSGNGVLELLGRTSLDGGDAPNVVGIRPIDTENVNFPVTYHAFVHASPDEVFFVINYSDRYLWVAFGQSQQSGLSGTGNWVSGQSGASNSALSADSTGTKYYYANGGIIFGDTAYDDGTASDWVHNDIEGLYPWSLWNGTNYGNQKLLVYLTELLDAQPNQFSGESVLLPIRAYKYRPDSKVSQVAELQYARHIRIDNYTDEQIITLGTDEWVVFPYYKRNKTYRDGQYAVAHTGTFGWAIKKA